MAVATYGLGDAPGSYGIGAAGTYNLNGKPYTPPAPTTSTGFNLAQVLGLGNDIFSSAATAASDFGQSDAQSAIATGDQQEADAYNHAAAVAQANETLALAAGQVEQAQSGLQLRKTLGSIRADTAANGFSGAGSALALLRSSTRQGQLSQQIIGLNSQEQAGGYEQQVAAANEEAAAATAGATAATSAANTENTLGAASRTNAMNEAATLGVNVPGLGSVSDSYIPSINVSSLVNQPLNPSNTTLPIPISGSTPGMVGAAASTMGG